MVIDGCGGGVSDYGGWAARGWPNQWRRRDERERKEPWCFVLEFLLSCK